MTNDHRANRLLAALEPDDFDHLVPYLEIVSLPAGAVLYEAQDTLRHAYFPHDMIVALVAILKDGRAAEMVVCGREGVLGLISTTVTRHTFGRYVVQTGGTASRIELDRLNEVIDSRPKIRALIRCFAEALMVRVLQNVACNAVHTVEQRCCRWILASRDRLDGDTIPLTHEFLAEMLGVQRTTVSKVTAALQEAGLIRQGRGTITVTDGARLEEASCECYGTVRRSFERLLPHTYTRG
jgi:CRP-like cAMP-binding protein